MPLIFLVQIRQLVSFFFLKKNFHDFFVAMDEVVRGAKGDDHAGRKSHREQLKLLTDNYVAKYFKKRTMLLPSK